MDLFLTISLGIAANIITPYIKKSFSVLMNKVSLRWVNRNERKKAILQHKVKIISDNSHEEIMLAMKVNRDFLYGLFFILLGVILIGLSIAFKNPEKIHIISGSIVLLYGVSHFSSNEDIIILQEVKRNRKMEK
jgi:hypothetical protein